VVPHALLVARFSIGRLHRLSHSVRVAPEWARSRGREGARNYRKGTPSCQIAGGRKALPDAANASSGPRLTVWKTPSTMRPPSRRPVAIFC
jgi:hypothetical protein